MDQSEKTLLNWGTHRVTTSKVKFGNVTFPIANIATVRYEKKGKFAFAVVAAAVCLLFGLLSFTLGRAVFYDGQKVGGFCFFALGTVAIASGFLQWRRRKTDHILSVTMNSGETHTLPSQDLDDIRQIEEAIHTAIAAQ